jgi:RHS repeat-associated protein
LPDSSVYIYRTMRQVWTDAFGKVVEVDEQAANASTGTSGTSTGTVTINGTEQSINECPNSPPYNCWYYDNGNFSATVGGVSASVSYSQGSTAAALATALASAFNSNPASPATASASGSVVTLTAKFNYSLSVSATTWTSGLFASPSFTASRSGGALTGSVSPPMTSPTVTYYLYDALSRLQQVTVVGSSECNRTYTYDNLSRMTASTEPEPGSGSCTSGTHTTNYYYTTAGGAACSGDPTKLCRRTDGRSTTTTYSYDTLNRPTGMTYSDSTPPVTYSYDLTTYNGLTITNGAGRRTGMSDGSGMTAWSYDLNGNIVTEKRTIAGITKTISYAYNLDNSLKQLTYPTGRVVNFTVGNAQRTTAAVDNTGTQYAIAPSSPPMYAPPGALASAVYGKSGTFTGLTESRSYNNRLQIAGISASSTGGTALNLAYSYTATGHTTNNGEIMSITNNVDTGRTQNLTYDDLSRISTANSQATSGGDCWGQSFTIDNVANLTGIAVTQCSANMLTAAVNGNNQFTTGYTYDAAGNLTGDGLYTYAYNAENEITSANSVTYTYDGNRMRVKKTGGTLYWRDVAGNVIAETDLSGNNVNEYVFFAGRRAVRRKSTGDTYYYQVDQVGSVRAITGSTGTVCYDTDYSPYGQEFSHTNTCAQNYKFTGYERDSETGLDYAMNRYYNSRIGRFMSSDPMGLASANFGNPQSMNRYAYVQNNPLSFSDPNGLYCVWDDGTYDDDPSEGGAAVGTCASQGGTWFDGSSPGANFDPNKTLASETQVAEGLGLNSLGQIQQTNIATLLASGNVSQVIDFVEHGIYGVDMLSQPWNQYAPPLCGTR